jgi:hypothetical protein
MSFSKRTIPGAVLIVALTIAAGCRASGKARIEPVYNKLTGRLELLKYDSNGDGRIDTWSYMDGLRVLRIEIDANEDGKIDRWEYYGDAQTLEKIGSSRADDGNVDTWSYPAADGTVERVDVSTRRNGRPTRTEHYAHDILVSAEEDTDEDGRFDRWETYDNGRLASVAFDTRHRGTPDRRMMYSADGTARLEIDAGGGRFLPIDAPPARAR